MEKSTQKIIKNLNYENYGFYWQIFWYTDDMWVQTWSIFFTARFARQRWCRFDQGWGVSRCLKVFLSRWETHIVWSHITGDLFGMPQLKNGIAVSWTSDYLFFQKGWCLHIAGIVFLLLLVWICQVWLDLSWPRSQWFPMNTGRRRLVWRRCCWSPLPTTCPEPGLLLGWCWV